jgi:lipoic acid synthetase
MLTKSSIMVGVGETDEEITETLGLLKEAGVDLVTIGQYLAPSHKHLAVDRFPEPKMYDEWAQHAIHIGFSGIASGPLVRSSFKAGLLLRKTQDPNNSESMPGAYVYVANQGNEAPVHLKSGME